MVLWSFPACMFAAKTFPALHVLHILIKRCVFPAYLFPCMYIMFYLEGMFLAPNLSPHNIFLVHCGEHAMRGKSLRGTCWQVKTPAP